MMMEGSCHCGAVRFTVNAPHPYPYNRCYCSICRKTAGGGGYAVNVGAEYDSLNVEGEDSLRVYRARITSAAGITEQSPAQRSFCGECASALWVWDPRWPELVHPFASAIDTELPKPPELTHMMLASKPAWVDVTIEPGHRHHDEYPRESLAEWHERLGVVD